jgi:hypothetical protein
VAHALQLQKQKRRSSHARTAKHQQNVKKRNVVYRKDVNMLASLIGPVTGLLDKFVEDKDQKAKLAHEIATMAEKQAHEIAIAQIEVNKVEAQSSSLFKSGWRPFLGWVCAAAFAYHFIVQPLVIFSLSYMGLTPIDLPEFDMGSLMTVLMGMLGLGGLRSFEKSKGLTK